MNKDKLGKLNEMKKRIDEMGSHLDKVDKDYGMDYRYAKHMGEWVDGMREWLDCAGGLIEDLDDWADSVDMRLAMLEVKND